MRALALLVLLTFIPLVSAVDDPLDDHEVGREIASAQGETHSYWTNAGTFGWYPMADLVRADITESQDNIQFVAELAGLEHQGTEPQEFFSYRVIFEFTLRDKPMAAAMEWYSMEEYQDYSYFMVGMQDPESYGGIQYTSGWQLDVDGSTLSVDMPKRYFRDDQYVPLREGDVLRDITVRTESSDYGFGGFIPVSFSACPGVEDVRIVLQGCPWQVRDEADALGDFTVELMPEGVGHLMMRSERPWRASNGLATTYLFEIELHNFDEESDTVLLQAVDVPRGWEVLHPASISFTTAESTLVPLAVTVPFAHGHGDTDFLEFQAQSTKNQAVAASTWVGVVFSDPPQPAGHHDKLYFHARESSYYGGWMNTVRGIQDGEGDRIAPGGRSTDAVSGDVSYTWYIRLDPRLATGLDFDVSGQVVTQTSIQLPVDMDATVTTTLAILGEERIDLATGETTTSFLRGQPQDLEVLADVLPVADRIPLGDGNLYLQIQVEGTTDPAMRGLTYFDQDALLLTEDSVLDLPLEDYHDEVDLDGLFLNAFNIGGNRTFSYINPGNTLAFVFNVTNMLSEEQTVDWTLTGANAEWATVSPQSTIVPASGDGQVVVRVTAPEGTYEGDAAELLLMGTSQEDESRQVFVRLTALVSEDIDVPDETGVADEIAQDVAQQNKALGKDSPGFELAAVIAGLAAIALMVRRKK